MAIFLTQYRDQDGRLHVGPDIRAKTRAEAEQVLATMQIAGFLVEDIFLPSGRRILHAPPEDEVLE